MNELVERIQQYEDKVLQQKEKRAKLQGKAESALQQLNAAGFESLEAAEEFITSEVKRLDEAEAELKDDITEFEGIYAEYLEADAG